MPENKTRPTGADVINFLNSVADEQRRSDSFEVLQLMKELTGYEPEMWGPSIVGFGSYHYKYDSGREGDMLITGFSPRKQALTLYIMGGFGRYDDLMQQLGKYKIGKSCLYVKKLSDVNPSVLKDLITESVNHVREKYDKS